jgi:hypothetical protein
MSDRAELEELRRLDELERKAAGSDEAPVVRGNGGAATAPAIPENTLGQEAKRQGGLFLRHALTALGSVGALPADAIGKAVNYATGREVVPNQQQALQGALTNLGLPEAERPIERFTQGMAESAPAFAIPAKFIPQVVGNAAISSAQAKSGEEGTGAAIGGAAGIGGHVLGKSVKALTPTEEALLLKSKGVPLTYGQTLGEPVQKLENTLARVPYVGAPIRKQQQEALQGWQQLTRDTATPEGATGLKTLDDISKHFDDAYGQLVHSQRFNKAPEVAHTSMVANAVKDVTGSTGPMANKLEHELFALTENAKTPSDFQRIESSLKKMGYRYRSSPDPEQQIYGEMIQSVAQQLREAWRSALPEGVRTQLGQVDTVYGNFIPVRTASSKYVRTLTDPEDYTPRMLLQAARQHDRSVGKTGFRSTPQGQVAAAGEDAIGSASNAPTSGSGILSLLAGGGASIMGYTPAAIAAAIAGAGYGTKAGQQLMLGTLPAQRMMAEALRRFTPATARNLNND